MDHTQSLAIPQADNFQAMQQEQEKLIFSCLPLLVQDLLPGGKAIDGVYSAQKNDIEFNVNLATGAWRSNDSCSGQDVASLLGKVEGVEPAYCQRGIMDKVARIIQKAQTLSEIREAGEGNTQEFLTRLPEPPLASFPEAVQDMLTDLSQAHFAPVEMPIAFFLGLIGTLVGGHVWLDGVNFTQPGFLWIIALAETGAGKSPVMKRIFAELINIHGQLAQEYQVAYAAWAQEKKGVMPVRKRLYSDDFTPEKFYQSLYENSGTLGILKDEFSGLFKMLLRYNQNEAKEQFLARYDGHAFDCQRKKDDGSIFIPSASVPICGGLQPGLLGKMFQNEDIASGLFGRINFVFAKPLGLRKWEDKRIIDPLSTNLIKTVTRSLAKCRKTKNPRIVALSNEATNVFARFFNEMNKRAFLSDQAERWRYEKATLQCQRVAAMLHCLDESLDGKKRDALSEDCMARAVNLANWLLWHNEQAFRIMQKTLKSVDPVEGAILSAIGQNWELIVQQGYKLTNSQLFASVQKMLPVQVDDSVLGRACTRLEIGHTKIGLERGKIIPKRLIAACHKTALT